MKKYVFVALMALVSTGIAQQAPANGEMRAAAGGRFEAWHQASMTWVTPESFWRRYAEGRGGVTWGSGSEYPPYAQVKETDTFLVELDSGSCLMMFWHKRWRRANDVRRWDTRFNDVGACPHVFK
ncbi:MAG: hypothetical protein AB8B96_02025 [Lysobacterales bacterium]